MSKNPKPLGSVEDVYEDVELRSKARVRLRFYEMLKLLGTALTEVSAIAIVVFFFSYMLDKGCK